MIDTDLESVIAEVVDFTRNRFFGKYRGIVQEVDDDQQMGRIKAKVPDIYGAELSPWALPASAFAGGQHGLVLIPEKGDGVWIEFEGGDVSRPLWTGFWWANGDMPADASKDARALITTKGHKLILDDGNEQIRIVHSGGAEVTMTNDDITLKLGSSKVVLSSSSVSINDGALEVQ